MKCDLLIATLIILCGAVISPAALSAASSDEAPSPAEQMTNPSKVEPMMIQPSPAAEAAAYQRDLADCDSHSTEGRQICRDLVNERYGVETSPPAAGFGRCDALEENAKAECLRGASAPGRELMSVKPRRLKKEAGQRPGFVV
jgi:hypothetical protein